jgi:hypothetical protein
VNCYWEPDLDLQVLNDTVNNISGKPLTTVLTFDVTGNVTEVKDPRGVTTDFAYTDGAGSCAFPTSIKHYPALGCNRSSENVVF